MQCANVGTRFYVRGLQEMALFEMPRVYATMKDLDL